MCPVCISIIAVAVAGASFARRRESPPGAEG